MNTTAVAWCWIGLQVAGLLMQLLVSRTSLWRWHRPIGGVLLAWYVVTFPLIFVSGFSVLTDVILTILTIYTMVNVARLWRNRFSEAFLRQAVVRDTWWLTAISLVIVAGYELIASQVRLQAAPYTLLVTLMVSIVVSIYIFIRVRQAVRRYQIRTVSSGAPLSKLPTVTLAIPARNETRSLDESLSMAIASDYPKLEILVLDDCSQDATASVIRSYARDGVRFVQGDTPAEGWQGKNYACQTLAEQASGDIIIFAGVDTHLGPTSIANVVAYMRTEQAEMVSVLPVRREFDFWPSFLEQLRNFWQIVLPKGRKRLPISSPCWAITAASLKRIGGFKAYKNSVFPEEHFAQTLAASKAYRFVLASNGMDITTRKRLHSQLETATRTFYPLLKRRPFLVLLLSTALTSVLLLPFGVLLWQLAHWEWNVTTVRALIPVVLCIAAHTYLLRRTNPKGWWVGLLNFPILVLFDALLYNWSMLQFEFGDVNWKGRNVCYPLIETIPMATFTAELHGKK